MNDDKQNYTLGRNVTAQAALKERRGTVRFTLEFSLEDFAAIEMAADARGIGVSGMVLEAFRNQSHRSTGLASLVLTQGKSIPEHVDYQTDDELSSFEESRASESEFLLQPPV